jgi:peptidyl-prolyl cis-trans isomerase C
MTRSPCFLRVTVLLALWGTVGCRRESALAKLGDVVIRESDFRRYVKSAYAPDEAARIAQAPSERQRVLDEYLSSLAVAAKAHREGIDREPRFLKAIELADLKIPSQMISERNRDRIVHDSQASPDEVRAYYEEHKIELGTRPRFTIRQLLVYTKGNPAFPDKGLSDAEARAKIEKGLRRLRAGQPWDVVARTFSDDLATNARGGLIRDGQFGYFPPEVERAVRTQELGRPGEPIKTLFGYHVLQVEERIPEGPRPFDEVKATLAEQLSERRAEEARERFLMPLREEAGLEVTDAGRRDGFLLDDRAVAPESVLARVGGKDVLESDFQWFVKDALVPEQRAGVYSRPGARQNMLRTYLDMLVLQVKAGKEGVDNTPEFAHRQFVMRQKLLLEFVQQRDKAGPFCNCGSSEDERRRADAVYFRRLRDDVGLSVYGERSPSR